FFADVGEGVELFGVSAEVSLNFFALRDDVVERRDSLHLKEFARLAVEAAVLEDSGQEDSVRSVGDGFKRRPNTIDVERRGVSRDDNEVGGIDRGLNLVGSAGRGVNELPTVRCREALEAARG